MSVLSPCSVPTPMLPTPTPDQAHRSHRAAWDTQLPRSSRRSTRTRPTGTELHPVPPALTLQDRPRSCVPGARLGPENVLYNHTSHLSHRHDPPPATGPSGGSHVVPGFGVRLEKKVLARFVLWICYFCSLLDMVQTDRCIFFSDSL